VRQLAIAAIQVIMVVVIYLFVKHLYYPATGIVGALLWIAGCLLLAFWMDGTLPWRYAAAITGLYALNFAVLFAVLAAVPSSWALAWLIPFAAFGYRLAGVIDGASG
jgi:hypothetical protein